MSPDADALEFCQDNAGYRNLIEDQIKQETEDVEELEKYLDQVEKLTEPLATGPRLTRLG